MGIETGTALLIGGLASAGAAAGGAAIQSSGANNAAEIQAASQGKALDFEKQYAEGDWRNQEATRQANFNQWAASQRRKGSIGELFGLPGVQIPAYVPSVDPNYTGNTGITGGLVTTGAPPRPMRPGVGIGGY